MIKGSIQEEDIKIINLYPPNIRTPQYIRQMLASIKGKINSNTIIMREFTPHSPHWTDNPNRILIKKSESESRSVVIKNLSRKKIPGPDCFTGKFYQMFREDLILMLLKLFQKFAEGGTLSSSFFEATLTLIQSYHKIGNYRAISLIYINGKVLNKILASRIQKHTEKIIHRDQVEFIPRM